MATDQMPGDQTSGDQTSGDRLRVDVVLEPFGADAATLVDTAQAIDRLGGGVDGIWVYDHFTAMMSADRTWSRDPFALLGAYAATTHRLRLGTLVANVYNRHPVQLASAIATVQSIADRPDRQRPTQRGANNADATAPTRVVCGIGSGAAPGTRFASEHDAIGVALDPGRQRRQRLIDNADAVRTIWNTNTLYAATDIVEPRARPPIIFGASGPRTVAAATAHADGVNIRDGAELDDLVRIARSGDDGDFEVSVLTTFDPASPLGTNIERFQRLAIDRLVLGVRSPFDPNVVIATAERLAEHCIDNPR